MDSLRQVNGALLIALWITLSAATASAQSITRNDSLANINPNLVDAASASVSQTGALSLSAITAGSASIFKEEDQPTVGDGGPGVLAVTFRNGDITNSTSTDGDYANATSDVEGRLYSTFNGQGRGFSFYGANAADIIDTTSTQVFGAIGGYRAYISAISCSNTSAAQSRVDLLDGATVIWTGFLPTGSGGKGRVRAWFPVPLRGSTNTAINVQMATTSMAARCAVNGVLLQ